MYACVCDILRCLLDGMIGKGRTCVLMRVCVCGFRVCVCVCACARACVCVSYVSWVFFCVCVYRVP